MYERRLLLFSALLLSAAAAGCSGRAAEAPPARQIVLVVVDTLRADHMGAYGYAARPTTPKLDAWSRQGRLYERCFATSPWTAPSFGSLLTGELPERHGVMAQQRPDGTYRHGRLDPGLTPVPERLAAEGWTTAAFVNNPFLSADFGLDRGFASYDRASGGVVERRANEMVDLALAWIDAHAAAPYFLLVHLFDPHLSYDAPPPWRGKFTRGIPTKLALPFDELNAVRSGALALDEGDRRFVVAAYDEEVAFVDAELDRLLGGLRTREVLQRGLVVLTSDHGEELFDHGGFEHGHALWQELVHVPLVVWGVAVVPGRDGTPVSIADVAPTILEHAGLAAAEPAWARSLPLAGGSPRERTLYAEQNLYGTELKAAVDWPLKLIANYEERSQWLFDLEANPREELRPWGGETDAAERLWSALAERVERERSLLATGGPTVPSDDTLERLRALGYLGADSGPPEEGQPLAEAFAALVHASYARALAEARVLEARIAEFLAAPGEATLDTARQAWRAARVSYGQTEVFRFWGGPIEVDPVTFEPGPELALNAWPLDEAYIDAVEGRPGAGIVQDPTIPINKESLVARNAVDDEAQVTTGYHAIEFLLWGQDRWPNGPGRRAPAEFLTGDTIRERRRDYLRVVTELLVEDLTWLVESWKPGVTSNYAAQFRALDSATALERVLTGAARLAGFELAFERLAVALDSGDQEDEHSCFSDNTHADLIANVQGIRNVWSGLGRHVRAADAELAALAERELEQVERGVAALHRPFDRLLATPAGAAERQQAEQVVASLRRLADLLELSRVRASAAARER